MITGLPISPKIASLSSVATLEEAPDLGYFQEGVIAELIPLGAAINDHGCKLHVLITVEDEENILRFASMVDLNWYLELMPARILMQPLPEDPGCLMYSDDFDPATRKPINVLSRQFLTASEPSENNDFEDYVVEATFLLAWWTRGGVPVRNTARFVEILLDNCTNPSVSMEGKNVLTGLCSLPRGRRPPVALATITVAFLETIIKGVKAGGKTLSG